MREGTVRALGVMAIALYAAFIVWLYARQPQTLQEVTGGIAAGIGAYRIDQGRIVLAGQNRNCFNLARSGFQCKERIRPANIGQ